MKGSPKTRCVSEALYQQGLLLRAQRRYHEAGQCFRQAADAGSGDACWEMYQCIAYGGCGIFPDTDAKAYLEKGVSIGNQLCCAERYNYDRHYYLDITDQAAVALCLYYWGCSKERVLELPYITEPHQVADVWTMYYYSRLLSRINGLTELANVYVQRAASLGLACAQYCLALSPFRDRSYLKDASYQCHSRSAETLLDQNDLATFANAEEIAHALVIVLYEDERCGDYIDMILKKNRKNLSAQCLQEVRARVGAHIYQYEVILNELDPDDPDQFEADEFYCLMFYRCLRRRARAAATAWLMCRRHGALPGISRDTARMVAERVLAEPLKFLF